MACVRLNGGEGSKTYLYVPQVVLIGSKRVGAILDHHRTAYIVL